MTTDELMVYVDMHWRAVHAAIGFTMESAVVAEREACAKKLELTNAELLLMAGEMTAQELRTVRAVLANRAAAIRGARFDGTQLGK